VHILFLDESGTPPSPHKIKNRYFVIGGLAIPEGKWSKLRDGLLGLKRRRKLRGEIKWRYFAPDNTEKENPMRDLGLEERNSIREEIYESIIVKERSVRTIACVTCIEAAYRMPSIVDRDDLYKFT
jgi:hypothetical protein